MQRIDLWVGFLVWFGFFSVSFGFCIAYRCQDVGSGGGLQGLASVRRGQGLPHVGHSWFHLVPADSAMDPP